MKARKIVKNTLMSMGINLTRNMKYDSLAAKIIRQNLSPSSNCIDVGSHEGEFLDAFLKYAPNGQHYAFEPIPDLFQNLKNQYGEKVKVYPFALSDQKGKSRFNYVRNAPAYSGLKQREYKTKTPDIEEIDVELMPLDTVIPESLRVHFIKIDVEGAEFNVLKGAKRILAQYKPMVLFEFGKGASDYYGTRPEDLFNYLTGHIDLSISSLSGFLKGDKPYSKEDFKKCYDALSEYYFIAHPISR